MPRKENQSNPNAATALDAAALGPIRRGAGPLYLHVYRRLAELIDSGALVEGARLPPSRFLAGQLAVSRFTVAYAYDLLAADGYTVGRGRAGTFVRLAASRPARGGAARPAPETGSAAAHGPAAGAALFSVGLAPVEFFPRKVWVNLVKRRLTALAPADLLPADPQGSLLLRRALANRLAITRGIVCTPEQVFVTRGIAGATALVAAAMVEHGDHVLVEDPAEPQCFEALRAAGAALHAVAVDAYGMDVEAGLAACARPCLAVVTPGCQFPLGVALSPRRRARLLEAAAAAGSHVLEHDIQTDYRFAGLPVRSLASDGGADTVIHALHLSEIVFPALAISCVTVPQALVARFRAACDRLPVPASAAEQGALVDLVRHGHILRYFHTALAACARRREALRAAFSEIGARIYVPDAGLHLVVALQRPLDETARAALRAQSLAPVPLARYSLTGRWPTSLAVGFASVPEDRARSAVAQLAQIVPLAG